MDCAPLDARFRLSGVSSTLPPELGALIASADTANNIYLDTLSRLASDPTYTSAILSSYEPLFPELAARWERLLSPVEMAVAFARVLPTVPYLAELAENFLLAAIDGRRVFADLLQEGTGEETVVQLLALYRLLSFSRNEFLRLVAPSKIEALLRHESRPVRYLAVRVLCLYLGAADAAQEDMQDEYGVGKTGEEVLGSREGEMIDYRFLPVLETKRLKKLAETLKRNRVPAEGTIAQGRLLTPSDYSQWTVDLCGILTPRLRNAPQSTPDIIETPTTRSNVRNFAQALRAPQPTLLAGPAGAGKTFTVQQVAQSLNALDTLVSIHLGDQTDAKLLIGAYTTADTPGSFEWRPGVLTTAVREGRWVLVEDIDKAPTEVLSVLLPLIERRELLIPSRGEKVTAARGFRLIATVRTAARSDGASTNILGSRLWNRIDTASPSDEELQTIVNAKFPLLSTMSPSLMSVYNTIQRLYREPSFFAVSKTSLGRQISPRDLFKWCTRIDALFASAGVKSPHQALSEALFDEVFMEAVDCFAGSLQTREARRLVVERVAEEMHVPSQRVDYFLGGHVPGLADLEDKLVVGRAKIKRNDATASKRRKKASQKKRPFAKTSHTLALLEQVGVAVHLAEPLLLVGETGTGKTTVVQQLADMLGYNLTVINLSQQTESGDLLGGYKPIDVRTLAVPLKERFEDLFEKTFPAKKNKQFLESLATAWNKQLWKRVFRRWGEAVKMTDSVFTAPSPSPETNGLEPLKKKRKIDRADKAALQAEWTQFSQDLSNLEKQSSQLSKSFAFSFVEGSLVKAARAGDWVLLDEINLAAPDTLESIADLLKDGGKGSILLSEKGEVERIQAHPKFRIFGCMNPATDVGKRDLPSGLRSRFTELYVTSPDSDFANLLAIIEKYIGHLATRDERACADVANLYMVAKKLAEDNKLVDGANQKPHFSLRTLTRTLSYVVEIVGVYGLRRSLYEGFCMSFLTLLDRDSERLLLPAIDKYLLGNQKNVRSLISQAPRRPSDGKDYIQFKHYWMHKGPHDVEEQAHYIITPFVERNMLNLVRATATRKFPVLIQGPTSSGKTSMIEYLAKRTGHKFVRINNHEHTDLQEYLGTYISESNGQLRFQEGILVEALRKGHWIVLDELNLAPTDVLEALNRLLDDNRELLIPETQEVVKPHKDFMLFATQNPPGLYGGRKNLSRAFRNRFLELHFDDIPENELEDILRERCQIAPSYCKKIVETYKDLSRLRQSSRLFDGKNSFATLRDLFRWANREAVGYQQLAENGYMLLAERVRKDEEKLAVKKVIEEKMRVKIDVQALYTAERTPEYELFVAKGDDAVVWTKAMQRLYSLVSHALRNREPVLLVGETGCGKTTVVQMLAKAFAKELMIVNAHQNTETGDIIGAQRPVRNRSTYSAQLVEDLVVVLRDAFPDNAYSETSELTALMDAYSSVPKDSLPIEVKARIDANAARVKALFEWADGSLIRAMKEGAFFLLDEISLADDSVLERINSVLEPQRGILLAEKGPEEAQITAREGFQFLATMNPGGDYGKKELSPALRNRFTEIWVPAMSDEEDVLQIVKSKLTPRVAKYADTIVRFTQWFSATYKFSTTAAISIRDVLAWINFLNLCSELPPFGLFHGASMVFVDGLGASPSAELMIAAEDLESEKQKCFAKLEELAGEELTRIFVKPVSVKVDTDVLRTGDFNVERNSRAVSSLSFSLSAPTTALNAMRIGRALVLRKPVLLEGSPGVGKTSLISALAAATGSSLTRINLSEQTDLMDLFGSDVPVEGGQSGEFAWRDAPFLQAMQRGHWVLLDEMNLASQSVLEGLNACLDHRGEAYVAELDRTFSCHEKFMVFAAQNPHHQGGGRKGLPASFVNRFTVVYVDSLKMDDLQFIAKQLFPGVLQDDREKLVRLVVELDLELSRSRSFGIHGGPWEFNLRDTLRWLEILSTKRGLLSLRQPDEFVDILLKQRFRTPEDRAKVDTLFSKIFGKAPARRCLTYNLSEATFQVGHAMLPRNTNLQLTSADGLSVLTSQLPVLETVMTCVEKNLPVILTGPSGAGKSSIIKLIAAATGAKLDELALNADIDTTDIVGGFEQVDLSRKISALFEWTGTFFRSMAVDALKVQHSVRASIMLKLIEFAATHITAVGVQKVEDLHRYLSEVEHLSHGSANATFAATLAALIAECTQVLGAAREATIARFEWVDGVLIQALQRGRWLVLDNANLCSPSVLDRLNSLLEPNGYLILNEHSDENGEPKLVRPHKNFRMFLTCDPKSGELSRAMRNRCVEVFVESRKEEAVHIETNSLETFVVAQSQLADIIDTPAPAAVYWKVVWAGLETLPIAQTSFQWQDQVKKLWDVPDGEDQAAVDLQLETFNRFMSHDGLRKVMDDFVQTVQAHRDLDQSVLDSRLSNPLRNAALMSHYIKREGFEVIQRYLHAGRTVFTMCKQEELIIANSTTNKLAEMTFLERAVSKRVNKARESGALGLQLFSFLSTIRKQLTYWLDHPVENTLSHDQLDRIRDIMALWVDMVRLTSSTNLDVSVFHVYLAFFQDWISKADLSLPEQFVGEIGKALKEFKKPLQLTTGRSMEIMWRILSPKVPTTLEAWDTYMSLLALLERFDKVALGEDKSEVFKTKWSLVIAASSVLRGEETKNLAKELDASITEIEATSHGSSSGNKGVFVDLFDQLLKTCFWNTSDTAEGICRLAHFAGRRTKNLLDLTIGSPTMFENMWAYPEDESRRGPRPVFDGRIGTDMLSIGTLAKGAVIGKLSEVDLDLKVLALHFTQRTNKISHTPKVTLDRLDELAIQLIQLMAEMIEIHQRYYLPATYTDLIQGFSILEKRLRREIFGVCPNLVNYIAVATDSEYAAIAAEHFVTVVQDISVATRTPSSKHKFKCIATAWVHFAMACLKLYVPNVAVDPAMKPILERNLYLHQRTAIEDSIKAEKIVQMKTTGQDFNFQIEVLEKMMQRLGDEPPNSRIVRPKESKMPALQGDLLNLLTVVVNSAPHKDLLTTISGRTEGFEKKEAVMQRNIERIITRLQAEYVVYKDIVDPIVGFLYYLKLGLSIATIDPDSEWHAPGVTRDFLTPLEPGMTQEPTRQKTDRHLVLNLWQYGARSFIEGYDNLDAKDGIQGAQQLLFERWQKAREEAQDKAAADSSWYQYKGEQFEDEEKELMAMFPTYEDNVEQEEAPTAKGSSHHELALEIAECHAAIFMPPQARHPETKLPSLVCKGAALFKFQENKLQIAPSEVDAFIPAIILTMKETSEWIGSGAKSSKLYDFYTDENIQQARELVRIVDKARKRMQHLLDNWPENVTLQDAVEFCKEILDFPISTPVAKFLTKVEKLHDIIAEWQSVAASEYSAVEHYDALTSLIVSWRKLELTTWPKLFDLEEERAVATAKSYWFFLYENIVANSMQTDQDMRAHAEQLVSVLMAFANTSSLGQFQDRLQMLRVFECQLSGLSQERHEMGIIHSGLLNVISFYSQFEGTVKERLAKDRKAVEKEVSDVVLLASWKDTNKVALRESAKRSHHKLYKVVRKYRAALDTSMQMILSSGMPEVAEKKPTRDIVRPASLDLDLELVKKIYNSTDSKWTDRPARLQDPAAATGMMWRVSAQIDRVEPAHVLEQLCKTIISDIKELQAETPAILNGENKVAIKHLKGRKRKAYTDTLKELRRMGLQPNPSALLLQKQASLATIMSTAAPLDATISEQLAGTQDYFLRVVEMFENTRKSAVQHSEDLTGPEVQRSLGYLEHLLSINRDQRCIMASALTDSEKLGVVIERYRGIADWQNEDQDQSKLWNDQSGPVRPMFDDFKRRFQWLPDIARFCADLVKTHCVLGKNKNDSFQDVENYLASIELEATRFRDRINSQKLLHKDIWELSTKHLLNDSYAYLQHLSAWVTKIQRERPEMTYAVKLLLPWVQEPSVNYAHTNGFGSVNGNIGDLDSSLQSLCDSIFVAMQKVKEAHSSYPEDDTETGWLLKSHTSLTAVLKSFHVAGISRRVDDVISQAAKCQPYTDENSAVIRALFAAYYPILHAYDQILQKSLQKAATEHRALSKMTYVLCSSATTLLTKGFCQPSEASEDTSGQEGKLESGTGLGEGEGAEDISKDVGDDEDLSEAAQEKDKEKREEELEDNEDAVDMGQDEMEGELGESKGDDKDEEGSGDEKEEENEMDEEVGDVDELDPNAVDEKLWDEKGEDDKKEKQGGDIQGQQKEGDSLEAKKEEGKQGEKKDGEAEEQEEGEGEEEGADLDDEVKQDDSEAMDQHVPEVETLELPEDLNLDGDEKSDKGDEDGDVDMADDLPEFEQEDDGMEDSKYQKEEDFPDIDARNPDELPADANEPEANTEEGENTEEGVQDEDMPDENEGEDIPEEESDTLLQTKDQDDSKEAEEAAPSDAQGAQGGPGQEQSNDQASAMQDSGDQAESTEDAPKGKGNDAQSQAQEGQASTQEQQQEATQEESTKQEEDAKEEQSSFRKVGDVLERWHKQRQQILDANDDGEERPQMEDMQLDDPEFEHLPKDETEADTQALGAATEEQAHGLDDSMAIDSGVREMQDAMEDTEEKKEDATDKKDEPPEQSEESGPKGEGRAGAMVGSDKQSASQRETGLQEGDMMEVDVEPEDQFLEEAGENAMSTDNSNLALRPREEARELWQRYEATTRALSAGLCEQLRLILEPTQATKMRGDFRTGKRLNMKRIIPYIASSYKKDKIWMRRAKPSKRQYQVILAVDDSRSMAESFASDLAMETVAVVARALSSLEAGQISVLSFGKDTRIVHPFDKPFTSDSGVDTFSRFTFADEKTDVKKLMETSLSLFSNARASASSSPTDLWQLEIVISDGICDDHGPLMRLLRRAQEQRVMVVFVVVDSIRKESILTMKQIEFVADPATGTSEVVSRMYLDSFPFGYYLVVSDVRELPSVLSGALRQWFAESVEAGG